MKTAEEVMVNVKDKSLIASRWHNFKKYDVAPEGYLTGDEFERRCIANISEYEYMTAEEWIIRSKKNISEIFRKHEQGLI